MHKSTLLSKKLNPTIRSLLSSVTLAVTFLACGSVTAANWTLDSSSSAINFISIKNANIAENHQFKEISGKVAGSKSVFININLNSVDTAIEIRNQRMKEHLFETDQFPSATISAELDPSLLTNLKAGSSTITNAPFKLTLHGQSQELTASIKIIKTSDSEIHVTSMKPIFVQANDFNLIAGILKLQQLAKLQSIDAVVPVTFNLVFNQES